MSPIATAACGRCSTTPGDLLTAAEQQALARLSVFRGSFDRAAAQAVAGVRATTLVALVDKSLLRQAGVGRYSLHELLRQFAAERLDASGEAAAMRAQHAAYYLALAEQAAPELAGPEQATGWSGWSGALDNLRAALSWCAEQGHDRPWAAPGRRAGALLVYPWVSQRGTGVARTLPHAGKCGRRRRQRCARRRSLRRACWRIRRAIMSRRRAGWSKALRAIRAGRRSRRRRARPDHTGRGGLRPGRPAGGAGAVGAEPGTGARDGRSGEVARALGNMGEAEYHLGDLASAAARHTEALALARQLGRTNLEAFQLGDLGNVARRQGDLVRATALHRQALELKHALGRAAQIAITLEDLAGVAGTEGQGSARRVYWVRRARCARRSALHRSSQSVWLRNRRWRRRELR